jgi:transposase InsO family protein
LSGLLKSLKTGLLYHVEYARKQQAKLALFEYIKSWYNRKKNHSAVGNTSPLQYQSYVEEKRMAT